MSYSTRSKTGHTPRKPENPGFVETPGGRARPRGRKSLAPDSLAGDSPAPFERNGQNHTTTEEQVVNNGSARKSSSKKRAGNAEEDYKVDNSGHFEFGGPWGVTLLMVFFPLLMYYMWIGATYYDGKLPWPKKNEPLPQFAIHLFNLAYAGAFPSLRAWAIYYVFFAFEAICYLFMPGGVYTEGKPLENLGGQKLQYYCSGVPSFYTTIAIALGLHATGIFPLWTLIDEFGPLMSVAIISGIVITIFSYFSAISRGATHRMTGYPTYDMFMGAELNPRLFKWLDFKMFFEVRLPWFILFFISLGACARQYEQYGYVSGELAFLLMAHWLYANACCKGEELIPPTWDIYFEKWGFMLIFWNMAGVPLTYCHCTIYLANHDPATYRWPRPFLAFLFVSYLFMYWVWDSAGSQKNNFRASQRGQVPERNAFPQLPWRKLENPATIPVDGGDDLLCDGWYKYARKIHYTSDMYFSICWALVTGFGSPLPWFYPIFFAIMIQHRARRDIYRCRERYGKSWEEFERRVPYMFIPYVF